MTVRDWLSSRTPQAPAPLLERLHELLGARADAPARDAHAVFLGVARETLAGILARRRFERDGALDLLAADALMTFAYEHAAEQGAAASDLSDLAHRGATAVAPLALTHA